MTRGLSVLRVVLEAGHARAATIAERTGLPVSTVYRHLRQLVEHEFVVERSGGYETGPALGSSTAPLSDHHLAGLSTPLLARLAAASGETALGVVRHGLHGVVYAQVESHHLDRLAYETGALLPLHAGAAQRVILAFSPDEVLRDLLSKGIQRVSAGSLNEDDLVRSLDTIRRDGYAVSNEELSHGGLAIAVPVRVNGSVPSSICLQGPVHRCTRRWQRDVLPVLRTAALELGEQLALEHSRSAGINRI